MIRLLLPSPQSVNWLYRSGKAFGALVEEKLLIIRGLPLIYVYDNCSEKIFVYDSLSCSTWVLLYRYFSLLHGDHSQLCRCLSSLL